MSAFTVEFDENFSIRNFTLKKFFEKCIETIRSGSADQGSTPLGTAYYGKFGEIYLDQIFLKNPSANDIIKNEISVLYDELISGDNVFYFDDWNDAPGKITIETSSGDDIIDFDDAELTAKSKKLAVNAGAGDDIIICSISHDERSPKKAPKVTFKGGEGRDVFYGVPRRLKGVVEDFDVNKDYLGFEENSRRFRLHETTEGVAVVDRRRPDGLLLLKGVDSVDQIIIFNENW